MENRTGYLARLALAAIPSLGLLLMAGGGSAFAGINEHNFHGRYVASYHAFDASITGTVSEPNPPAIPYAVSGAMFSDGKGNLSGFLNENYGAPGTGAASSCSLLGSYTVGSAPVGTAGGFVTINLTSSCKTVTCTGTTVPSCAVSGPVGQVTRLHGDGRGGERHYLPDSNLGATLGAGKLGTPEEA